MRRVRFARCYNRAMDVGDIHFYRERWKEVAEVERRERRALSIAELWRRLNAIARFAQETGLHAADDGEGEVWERWARLKERHESDRTRKP